MNMAVRAAAITCAMAVASCGGDLGPCGGANQPCCASTGCSAAGYYCQGGMCSPPGRTPVDLKFRSQVDVLFMVDNSPSMEAMSHELRNRFGEFFEVFSELSNVGFYADLHIGVVTSDYGAGKTGAPGCQPSPGGQKGKLQAIGAAAPANCRKPVNADFLHYQFAADGDGPNNLPPGQDLFKTFTCMASVGANGCGFEHQLESTYAALHNPDNGEFVRDRALLAVVFLTNEDDCSAPPESDLFDGSIADYGYEDSYRCSRYGVMAGSPPQLLPSGDSGGPLSNAQAAPNPNGMGPGKLYDVSRYVDYFTSPGGAKSDPRSVVLVGIDAPETPVQTILSDPDTAGGTPYPMCRAPSSVAPVCQPVLQHACQNPDQPVFFGDPSVRLNTVIQSAAHNQVSSICSGDYTSALKNLGNLIASQLGLGCIGNMLPPNASEPAQVSADCVVTDVTEAGGKRSIYEIARCDALRPVYPCWRIEKKDGCIADSPQGLGITIDRNGSATPANANIHASCVTITK